MAEEADAMLEELRTIRTLLALDKEERLDELTSDLSEIQQHILNQLDFVEWKSLSRSEIADELDVGETTVSKHRTSLVESNLVAKRGQGRGAKYRKTGLLRAAEQIGVVEE